MPVKSIRKKKGITKTRITAKEKRSLHKTVNKFLHKEAVAEYIPIARPQTGKKPFVENYSLPQKYDRTNITLMPRDPKWIHAYWDISPKKIKTLKKKLGEGFDHATLALRMYDITSIDFNGKNANNVFDVNLNSDSNQWYINLWKDNVSYCGDLGFRTPDGDFHTVARSNIITTPPEGTSWRSDLIWMDVKDEDARDVYVIVEELKKRSGIKASQGRKFHLTEDDIRAYYSRLFPLLNRFLKRRRGRKRIKGSKFSLSLDEFLRLGLSKEAWLKRLLGASEELVWEGMGGASESIFSGASVKEEKKRQFFFELWTELLVYGRTEPNAQVWHGDKKVKLKSDGTFSLRFALPDQGHIPLDFLAESFDKLEQREIKTAANRRKTTYKTKLS